MGLIDGVIDATGRFNERLRFVRDKIHRKVDLLSGQADRQLGILGGKVHTTRTLLNTQTSQVTKRVTNRTERLRKSAMATRDTFRPLRAVSQGRPWRR